MARPIRVEFPGAAYHVMSEIHLAYGTPGIQYCGNKPLEGERCAAEPGSQAKNRRPIP